MELKRNIQPKMVEFIDKKLKAHGLYILALEKKDARTLCRLAMEAMVGIKEATGKNDGPMVKLICQTIGGWSGEPYCMGTVQTAIAYAEVKTGLKSPIIVSEHCQTVWNKTPKVQRVKTIPLAGAIAIWGDVGKSSGHTELVLSSDGKSFQAVGGNTSGTTKPGQAVNREGNGVYYTVRSHKSTAKRALLGFLKPF